MLSTVERKAYLNMIETTSVRFDAPQLVVLISRTQSLVWLQAARTFGELKAVGREMGLTDERMTDAIAKGGREYLVFLIGSAAAEKYNIIEEGGSWN